LILIFFIDTFVSLAIPSLQLRLTTSLFSNLDSTLKTNTQYLGIVQCRVLVLICSHILLRSCLSQIPLAICSAFNSDHYAHLHSSTNDIIKALQSFIYIFRRGTAWEVTYHSLYRLLGFQVKCKVRHFSVVKV
jgi:hypothetical protein